MNFDSLHEAIRQVITEKFRDHSNYIVTHGDKKNTRVVSGPDPLEGGKVGDDEHLSAMTTHLHSQYGGGGKNVYGKIHSITKHTGALPKRADDRDELSGMSRTE
jgi:hypothetical protein